MQRYAELLFIKNFIPHSVDNQTHCFISQIPLLLVVYEEVLVSKRTNGIKPVPGLSSKV